MTWKWLCLAVVVGACAREKPAAQGSAAGKYAGTWEGRSFRSSSDTGVPWTTELTASGDTMSGTIAFAGGGSPIAERMIDVSDSLIVLEIGPYHSPTANADVITRSEGHVVGDSLWGTYVMLPTAGGSVIPNMSTARWKNMEMHPASGSEPIRGTFAAKRKPVAR